MTAPRPATATVENVADSASPKSHVASRSLRVREHDAEGLLTLRPEWDRLLRDSDADTMFLRHDWQQSWWQHWGGDAEARIVELRRHDRLTGIAPLQLRREPVMGVPLRTLRLLGDGSGDGDDLDVIARRGAEAAVATALLRHLDHAGGWDVLRLRPVPSGSATLRAIRRTARVLGWFVEDQELACTTSTLPDTWEGFLSELKSRFRSKLRSSLRRHVDVEEAEVRMIRRDAELDGALERLFDLHTARWNEIGEPGSFADDRRRKFFRDFAVRALRRGWLRLYELRWQGEVAAVQIGYVYDGTFLQIQEGFDMRFADISPGVALRAAIIRDCIESGVHTYDNLLGTSRAKMRWGGERRVVRDVWIGRGRGAALLHLRQRLRPWRRRFRQLRDSLPGPEKHQ